MFGFPSWTCSPDTQSQISRRQWVEELTFYIHINSTVQHSAVEKHAASCQSNTKLPPDLPFCFSICASVAFIGRWCNFFVLSVITLSRFSFALGRKTSGYIYFSRNKIYKKNPRVPSIMSKFGNIIYDGEKKEKKKRG